MEAKLEGFDPTQHRMLEDDKSWIDKTVPKSPDVPMEIILQYNQFVDQVTAANPSLSSQQAYDKIKELEKKYDNYFFGFMYSGNPSQQLVRERRKLSQLEELNLINNEDKLKLEQLRADIARVANEVAEKTGDDSAKTQKDIDSTIMGGAAQNLSEAKEILINGPIVEGFEETQDVRISNAAIREFLKNTFTLESLRIAKVGKICKNDKYQIFRGKSQEQFLLMNELLGKGMVTWNSDGTITAEDRDKYLKAEMILEGVDDPDKLKHIFKVRAVAGQEGDFRIIQLRSFGVEKPADFDYLGTTGLDLPEDQMRAYILGTIVHEVAHRYEGHTAPKNFDEYKQIIEGEISGNRPKYVSDYVLRHAEVYGSDFNLIFREDFAEAVRIYTTNPDYLKANYPRRFDFIMKTFPFIKAGGVVEAVKRLKK